MDKLAARGSEQRDAYSRGTQHSLLRLIEGMEIRADGKVIHTEDLLFIFGGAFSGIGPQVEHRNPIGFGAQPSEKSTRNINAEDFSPVAKRTKSDHFPILTHLNLALYSVFCILKP